MGQFGFHTAQNTGLCWQFGFHTAKLSKQFEFHTARQFGFQTA